MSDGIGGLMFTYCCAPWAWVAGANRVVAPRAAAARRRVNVVDCISNS
ncbi:Uncharacterised protein [Bordetella pertussis]|nr:Uncharacterised protein [Bordetella pertussis]